jgi:hypothetical protein
VFPLLQLVTCLLILALSATAQTSFDQVSTPAQQGFTGIFGGGPFYKTANFNIPKNIAEIEHSGFSEAIVWSVEVNSQGDLNFNGESDRGTRFPPRPNLSQSFSWRFSFHARARQPLHPPLSARMSSSLPIG